MTGQEARDDEREALSRTLQGIVEDGIDLRDAVDAVLAWMKAAGYRKHPEPEIGTPEREQLRQVWLALGCALNPDDFKPEVRATMWAQALNMIRKSTARDSRIYRENQSLEAEIARLRSKHPEPEITDELAGSTGRRFAERVGWYWDALAPQWHDIIREAARDALEAALRGPAGEGEQR